MSTPGDAHFLEVRQTDRASLLQNLRGGGALILLLMVHPPLELQNSLSDFHSRKSLPIVDCDLDFDVFEALLFRRDSVLPTFALATFLRVDVDVFFSRGSVICGMFIVDFESQGAIEGEVA